MLFHVHYHSLIWCNLDAKASRSCYVSSSSTFPLKSEIILMKLFLFFNIMFLMRSCLCSNVRMKKDRRRKSSSFILSSSSEREPNYCIIPFRFSLSSTKKVENLKYGPFAFSGILAWFSARLIIEPLSPMLRISYWSFMLSLLKL